jgi:hypothetical protein
VTVNAVGGSPWYARALDALSGRPANVDALSGRPANLDPQSEAAGEQRPQASVSLDDVSSPRAQRNLERVASGLGMDPAALLAQLTSGQDARSLLSRAGDGGYGTSVAQSTTGGLAIDQYA